MCHYDESFSGDIFRRNGYARCFNYEALAQVGAVAILSLEENKGKIAYFGAIDKAKFKQKVYPGSKIKLDCEIY